MVHTSLFGVYIPSQLGGVITSPVELTPFGREKLEINNGEKIITRFPERGDFFAGQKIKVKITKLANGDVLVNEFRKGWAPIPSTIPICLYSEYTLR